MKENQVSQGPPTFFFGANAVKIQLEQYQIWSWEGSPYFCPRNRQCQASGKNPSKCSKIMTLWAFALLSMYISSILGTTLNEQGNMRDIIEHVQSDISPKSTNITRGKRRRGKKPCNRKLEPLLFREKYQLTDQQLGEGSSSKVVLCINKLTGVSVAVKVVQKTPGIFSRSKMLKEIETFYLCEGQDNILQLLEFFEEPTCFYLVFEKMEGGQLLDHIKKRAHFSEKEAARIIRDMARFELRLVLTCIYNTT